MSLSVSTNPGGYGGVKSPNPPTIWFVQRDPTVNDWQNFSLMDEWCNIAQGVTRWFKLLSLENNQGNWQLQVSTGTAIDSIAVQTGISPAVPDINGLITFNGAVVAAGTNPVRTDGTAVNTFALEVQISQAIASTNINNIGLSAFNSAHFSVDASGFVSLLGGGQAVDSFEPDTGTNPVVPDSGGLVAIKGQSTPNVSGIQVTGSLNELDISMFSPFMGSFVFTNAAIGTTQAISVMNTSNTAGSNAVVEIDTAGVSAGIAIVLYTNGVSNAWSSGIASTASAPYIISSSNSLGSPRLEISTTGAVTFNNAYTFPTSDGTNGQTLVTNGAGQLSFNSNSALFSYTAVNTSPYVVLSTDEFLGVNTAAPITIQLPDAPSTGRIFVIKDSSGNSAANNITVTTVGGVVNIDGATSRIISTNYQSINVLFDGSTYQIY